MPVEITVTLASSSKPFFFFFSLVNTVVPPCQDKQQPHNITLTLVLLSANTNPLGVSRTGDGDGREAGYDFPLKELREAEKVQCCSNGKLDKSAFCL